MVFNRNGLPIGQIVLPDRDKGRNLKSTSLAIRPGIASCLLSLTAGPNPSDDFSIGRIRAGTVPFHISDRE